MVTMKIIGCILVVCSSAGFGLYFSSVLKDRIKELKELKQILTLLRGDIRYACTPLAEAFYSISCRHQGSFSGFLRWISEQLDQMQGKTIAEIWETGVKHHLKDLSFNKKDLEALIHFGANLGYLDKDMQLATIDLYLTTIETEIEEAVRTMKEKTYLYNSLGIMAGIFLTIILI